MHQAIEHHLADLLPQLAQHGIAGAGQREIPYGVQLSLAKNNQEVKLNIYYSPKKGISQVLSGKPGTALKNLVQALLEGSQPLPPAELALHHWQAWIGSDECGKGDYFGAPVVCAFAYDRSLDSEFKRLGVKDSKELHREDIQRIAMHLYQRHPGRIACIALKPVKYNDLIASFKKQARNLNHLLAWLHGTAILELLPKRPDTQGILVDQFSVSKRVCGYLKEKQCPVPCLERPQAESDPAVAAASILARYQFIQARESLDRFYQMKLPLGASNQVIAAALEFCRKYGFDRLGEVAKLHFVTTEKVRQALLPPHK